MNMDKEGVWDMGNDILFHLSFCSIFTLVTISLQYNSVHLDISVVTPVLLSQLYFALYLVRLRLSLSCG
jgi:hypothetical protein